MESARRANPQNTAGIAVQGRDAVVCEAGLVSGAGLKTGEGLPCRIIPVETVLGADPQSAAVRTQRRDVVVTQAGRLGRIGAKHPEGVTVIAVEPILRAHPDESLGVLGQALGGTL